MFACISGAANDPRQSNNCKRAAGIVTVKAPVTANLPTPPTTPPVTPPVTPPGRRRRRPLRTPPDDAPHHSAATPPAGVVLVTDSTSVALTSHHYADSIRDNPGIAKEVVVRNIGATTTGPLIVDRPTNVSENCGLGNSSPCKDLDPEPCVGATLATGEQCSMLLYLEVDSVATLNGELVVRDRTGTSVPRHRCASVSPDRPPVGRSSVSADSRPPMPPAPPTTTDCSS